ncbi:hypothetical protein Btru_047675 [Bulinus truncatus]|nr:hypothetical protein Btru_047675 [Bulinus truncatus]
MEICTSPFNVTVDLWVALILGISGLFSNILNTSVFWKLGFTESSNISLMTIAFIDCIKCSVGFFSRVHCFIGLADVAMSVNWQRVAYFVNSHVQNCGVSVVNVITMYLTIERCLCLCLPLKVKSIITPRTTVYVILSVTCAVHLFLWPMFSFYYISWSFDLNYNRSMAVFRPTDLLLGNSFIGTYLNITYLVWCATPFMTILVGTFVIIVKLHMHMKFRSLHADTKLMNADTTNNMVPNISPGRKCSSSAQKQTHIHRDNRKLVLSEYTEAAACQANSSLHSINRNNKVSLTFSKKNVRLVKMLLLIVLVYSISILPRLVITVVRVVEPEFIYNRQLNDSINLSYQITYFIDLLVANSHIGIYLAMSSQYRQNCGVSVVNVITMYLTIKNNACVCVLPLKVKLVLTPKATPYVLLAVTIAVHAPL